MSFSSPIKSDSGLSAATPSKEKKKGQISIFKSPLIRFVLPIVFAIPVVFLALSDIEAYGATIATFFFAFGTGEISAIIVGTAMGLNPFIPALLVAFIESDMSLFITWNFEYLKKIPKIGKYIAKYEEKAGEVLKKRKSLEEAGFFSIFAAMFVPLHGTGAITMTLVGRLIAISERKTWLAVTLGSLTRSLVVAALIYLGILALH